jgi:hypothetical protein
MRWIAYAPLAIVLGILFGRKIDPPREPIMGGHELQLLGQPRHYADPGRTIGHVCATSISIDQGGGSTAVLVPCGDIFTGGSGGSGGHAP